MRSLWQSLLPISISSNIVNTAPSAANGRDPHRRSQLIAKNFNGARPIKTAAMAARVACDTARAALTRSDRSANGSN